MGSSLTIKTGVGIEIPWLNDETELPESLYDVFADHIEFEDYDGERYIESFDEYDAMESITKRFPLLDWDMAYANDYSYAGALMVASTAENSWDGITAIDLSIVSITSEEEAQLREAAEYLGLEYNPQVLVLASFG